ncbi:MAG: type II toxin-antitoxin system Phd/YefM family antitoxin [Longimicrobiales bacterium]
MKKDQGNRPARRVWKLHEAKAHFSELFKRVRSEGPQRVVKQGGEAVVIVPAEVFDQMTQRGQQPSSLVEFFQAAPVGAEALDLARKPDVTRMLKW